MINKLSGRRPDVMLKALGRESLTWSTLPERLESLSEGKLKHSRTGNKPGGMLTLKIKVRKEGRGEGGGKQCFKLLCHSQSIKLLISKASKKDSDDFVRRRLWYYI